MNILGKLLGQRGAADSVVGSKVSQSADGATVDEEVQAESSHLVTDVTETESYETVEEVAEMDLESVVNGGFDPSDDGDDDNLASSDEDLAEVADPVPVGAPRKRRNRTRLLGVENSDGKIVDLFSSSAEAPAPVSTKFPVGWIIVLDGPGRGECFTLQSGKSTIGRGDDQTIQLDFGDDAISRSEHAAIVFDPEEFRFHLGQGGKSNTVYLNGSPVTSNVFLKHMDRIILGETTVQLIGLCNKYFNWAEKSGDET